MGPALPLLTAAAYCCLLTADCLLPLSEAGWRGVFPGLAGGPGEVRTLDLMTASHARSQLRHRPFSLTYNFYHGGKRLSMQG